MNKTQPVSLIKMVQLI